MKSRGNCQVKFMGFDHVRMKDLADSSAKIMSHSGSLCEATDITSCSDQMKYCDWLKDSTKWIDAVSNVMSTALSVVDHHAAMTDINDPIQARTVSGRGQARLPSLQDIVSGCDRSSSPNRRPSSLSTAVLQPGEAIKSTVCFKPQWLQLVLASLEVSLLLALS